MFGLSNIIYEQIVKIARKYEYKIILFGSRARGNYKANSDIDIAIVGECNEKTEYLIKNDFDLLDIPYQIDIVFVKKGIKKELQEAIEKEGVEI